MTGVLAIDGGENLFLVLMSLLAVGRLTESTDTGAGDKHYPYDYAVTNGWLIAQVFEFRACFMKYKNWSVVLGYAFKRDICFSGVTSVCWSLKKNNL